MLDENLPAFFLKPSSSSGVKHHRDVFSSYKGSDPAPAYSLHTIDPASTASVHKNCYAAALFDAYSPDILFGEVLARPAWTQPTLSADELRRNGGIPPPPQPILPHDVTIQLYEPDQQIRIEVKESKFIGSQTFEFSMPAQTFRHPSASNLDRGQSDPASLAITPKINFVWRRESKLSKDWTCFMTGKSTDTAEKKFFGGQKRDPDIAVALWRGLRELTLYESNVQRLEMEDPKGLEVVLLLCAVVIRDLFFSPKEHLREVFNVSDVHGERKLSGGGRKLSSPAQSNYPPGATPGASSSNGIPSGGQNRSAKPSLRVDAPTAQHVRRDVPPPPMPDPRAQWELDAETARLRKVAEAEAREAADAKRRREKKDEAEARRLQKALEAEEREKRRKEAEIEKETERLRKQYGVQQLPPMPPRPHPPVSAPYGRGSVMAGSSMMSGGNGNASVASLGLFPGNGGAEQSTKKKKSFFGLRSLSDEDGDGGKLKKKGSSMW